MVVLFALWFFICVILILIGILILCTNKLVFCRYIRDRYKNKYDKLLLLSAITNNFIMLVMLVSLNGNIGFYLDIIAVYMLINFIATVGFAKFFASGS